MRKILMFLVLIVSINSFGQGSKLIIPTPKPIYSHFGDIIYGVPANYQYRVVYERLRGLMPDSVLHIPRYNGVPVGLRGGSSTNDGAIAFDTLNGHIYGYWNTAWFRLANFSEVPSATGQLFGFSDTRGTTNRRYSGAGNSFMLDSLDVTIAANDSFYVYDVGGADRIDINRVASRFWSPDGLSRIDIFRDTLDLHLNATSSKLLFSNLSSIAVDTTNYKPVVIGSDERVIKFSSWAGLGGGATPTLQQVLTAGSTLTGSHTITESANNLTFTGTNSVATVVINQTGGFGSALNLSSSGTYTLFSDNSVGTYGAYLRTTNSSTNTVLPVLHLERNSTGTAAAGIGAGIRFTNEFSDGSQSRTHDINATLTNVTPGSFTGEFDLLSYDVGALETFMNIQASGVVRVNDLVDTLATRAYARSVGGGGGGSGTVTSVSVVDANGFTGSVANPTTTPAITLNLNSPSFEPWYKVYSNFGYSDQPLFRLSSFGSGSTIGTLNTTTIFDGWEFGLYMETGTTTTGSAYSYGYSSGNVAGIAISNSFRYNVGGLVRIDDLSDGTDTYNYSLGFGDDWGNGVSSIVDGAYFEYTHSLNSGNWTCTTESNGTKTQTDSGIPVVADQDVTLEVSVFNGNAFFYINKTLVATNTTNIPTGTARATSLGHAIAKTAGTTNRKAYCEWFAYGKRSN